MTDKWIVKVSNDIDFQRYDQFARLFAVYCFKKIKNPPEGVELKRGDYKGFIFKLHYKIPFYVERWR